MGKKRKIQTNDNKQLVDHRCMSGTTNYLYQPTPFGGVPEIPFDMPYYSAPYFPTGQPVNYGPVQSQPFSWIQPHVYAPEVTNNTYFPLRPPFDAGNSFGGMRVNQKFGAFPPHQQTSQLHPKFPEQNLFYNGPPPIFTGQVRNTSPPRYGQQELNHVRFNPPPAFAEPHHLLNHQQENITSNNSRIFGELPNGISRASRHASFGAGTLVPREFSPKFPVASQNKVPHYYTKKFVEDRSHSPGAEEMAWHDRNFPQSQNEPSWPDNARDSPKKLPFVAEGLSPDTSSHGKDKIASLNHDQKEQWSQVVSINKLRLDFDPVGTETDIMHRASGWMAAFQNDDFPREDEYQHSDKGSSLLPKDWQQTVPLNSIDGNGADFNDRMDLEPSDNFVMPNKETPAERRVRVAKLLEQVAEKTQGKENPRPVSPHRREVNLDRTGPKPFPVTANKDHGHRSTNHVSSRNGMDSSRVSRDHRRSRDSCNYSRECSGRWSFSASKKSEERRHDWSAKKTVLVRKDRPESTGSRSGTFRPDRLFDNESPTKSRELTLEELEEGEVIDEADISEDRISFGHRKSDTVRTSLGNSPRKENVESSCRRERRTSDCAKLLFSDRKVINDIEFELLPQEGVNSARFDDAWDLLEIVQASTIINDDSQTALMPSTSGLCEHVIIKAEDERQSPHSPEPDQRGIFSATSLGAPASPDADLPGTNADSVRAVDFETVCISSDDEERLSDDSGDHDSESLLDLDDYSSSPLSPFEITIRSNSVSECITLESEDVLRARAFAAFANPVVLPAATARVSATVGSDESGVAVAKGILCSRPAVDNGLVIDDKIFQEISFDFGSLLPPNSRSSSFSRPTAFPHGTDSAVESISPVTTKRIFGVMPTLVEKKPLPDKNGTASSGLYANSTLLQSFRGFGPVGVSFAGPTVDVDLLKLFRGFGTKTSNDTVDSGSAASTNEVIPNIPQRAELSVSFHEMGQPKALVSIPPNRASRDESSKPRVSVSIPISRKQPVLPPTKNPSRFSIEAKAVSLIKSVIVPMKGSVATTAAEGSFFKRMIGSRSPARAPDTTEQLKAATDVKSFRTTKFATSNSSKLGIVTVDAFSLAPPNTMTKFTTAIPSSSWPIHRPVPEKKQDGERPSRLVETVSQLAPVTSAAKRKRERSKSSSTKLPIAKSIPAAEDVCQAVAKNNREAKNRANVDSDLDMLELSLEEAFWEDSELGEQIHELEKALQTVHSKKMRVWNRLDGLRTKVEQVTRLIDPENAEEILDPSQFDSGSSREGSPGLERSAARNALDCPNYIRVMPADDPTRERSPDVSKDFPLLRIIRVLKKSRVKKMAPGKVGVGHEQSLSFHGGKTETELDTAIALQDQMTATAGPLCSELGELIDSLGLFQFRAGFANTTSRNPFSETFINRIERNSAYCFCEKGLSSCLRQHLPTMDLKARKKLIKAELRKALQGSTVNDQLIDRVKDETSDFGEFRSFWVQVARCIPMGECKTPTGSSL